MSEVKEKPKATVGRIVHFVPVADSPESANYAKVVPAIVVAAWGGPDDLANLKVFTDSAVNTWAPSVKYNEEKAPGTWHWPLY